LLGFSAIGLGTASVAHPMNLTLAVTSPGIKVQVGKAGGSIAWDHLDNIAPPGDQIAQITDGQITMQTTITSGVGMNTASHPQLTISPPAQFGQTTDNQPRLYKMTTGKIPDSQPSVVATFLLEADMNGKTIRRVVEWPYYVTGEIGPYDQNATIVAALPPDITPNCVHGGGQGGVTLQCTDTKSESRARTVTSDFNTSAAAMLGGNPMVGPNPFGGVFQMFPFQFNMSFNKANTWTQTFGVNISENATNESSHSASLSQLIVPGMVGACFQQAMEIKKQVSLYMHDICGTSANVGHVILYDWAWNSDLKTKLGDSCITASDLPPAFTTPGVK